MASLHHLNSSPPRTLVGVPGSALGTASQRIRRYRLERALAQLDARSATLKREAERVPAVLPPAAAGGGGRT